MDRFSSKELEQGSVSNPHFSTHVSVKYGFHLGGRESFKFNSAASNKQPVLLDNISSFKTQLDRKYHQVQGYHLVFHLIVNQSQREDD